MRAFFSLVRKDLLSLRWYIGVLVVLSVTWHGFLATRVGVWDEPVIIGLGFIPFAFLPIWLVISSFAIMEWKEDTNYLILSLPQSAWKIMVSKLTAVLLGGIAGVVVIGLGFFIFSLFEPMQELISATMWSDLPPRWYLHDLVLVCLSGLLIASATVMVIHFAYIASRMANRFRGLVLVWILMISGWLIARLSNLIEPLFRWLPDVRIEGWTITNMEIVMSEIWLPVAPFITPLLVIVGLYVLAAWLWETQIEIA